MIKPRTMTGTIDLDKPETNIIQSSIPDTTQNPITSFDPQKETQEALKNILDRVSFLILTIGVITMIISISRLSSQGWHPNIILDICFYIVLLTVVILRKFIPISVVMGCILVLTGINSFTSFFTVGLATISFVMLTTTCISAGIFFGIRIGITALIASIIITAGIGVFVIMGKTPGSHLEPRYLYAPQTWMTQIAAYGVLTSILLAITAIIMNKLSISFKKVLNQSEEIKKREEKYRFLADNMQDVLFIQDIDFKIVYSSPSIEKLFGYTPKEALSLTLKDIMIPESFKRAGELFQHYVSVAVKEDIDVPLMEFEYLRKDGTTFWGEFKSSFLRDEKGNLIGSQGILRDVTERKEATLEKRELEQKLRQSEKLQAIGQLAGGIAHDFNNQLTGVIGFANLLKHQYPDDKRIIEYADSILTPSRRATDLTDKLLAFASDGAYEQKPVDMHKIIDEVISILERSIDKTIRIVLNFDIKKAFVLGDATQLENVILNLALNARDAITQGGQITFLTQVRGDSSREAKRNEQDELIDNFLEITVADTGIGIDENIRHRIFEPFFTTKEQGHGAGMGLPAVYGAIKNHNGTIDVKTGKNIGTSFIIRLPLCKYEEVEKAPVKGQDLHKGAGNILVIDDEEPVRNMITLTLETLGYSITAFSEPGPAIDFYKDVKGRIDCILLDIVLPAMSGMEVFDKLRSIDRNVKVLFISGYTADVPVRSLIREGVVHFLKKPFTTGELSEKLAEVMGEGDCE